MDHEEAIRLQAVDRYLLNELTNGERQAFEEHFFSCSECSEDLHTGAILIDNSRAVLREEFLDSVPASPGVHPSRSGWFTQWSYVPMAAAVALLAVVSYQNIEVLPNYRRQLTESVGAAAPPHFRVRSAVRGATPVIPLAKGTRFFEVEAEDVDPADGGYECSVEDAAAKVYARLHAPAVPAGERLSILLDTRTIVPGQYQLVVRRASDGAEVGRFPFSVQMK
jgi:hypothetical protein